MIKCNTCGSLFRVKPSRVGKAKYCSRSCKHADIADVAERFWEKVDRSGGTNACWPWTAWKFRDGYGGFRAGHTVRANRMAWELIWGKIPDDLCVCHHCDHPHCCNPGHMFLGSQAENSADRNRKGRTAYGNRSPARLHPESRPRGSAHSSAKLTEDAVMEIRLRHAAGERFSDLGRLFGVSNVAARMAAIGRTWKHVSRIAS
jgi:hypothetical protein